MVDNTHSDPTKQDAPVFAQGGCTGGCGGGNGGACDLTPVTVILTEILDKLCALEIPDLTILNECLATLKELIAELPDYSALFEGLLAELQAICTKLDTANVSLAAILAMLTDIKATLDAMLACLNEIKTLTGQQLEVLNNLLAELVDQGVSLDEILACLKEIKALNAQQLEVLNNLLAELTDQGLSLDEILACLKELKDLSKAQLDALLSISAEVTDQGLTLDAILECIKEIKDNGPTVEECCTGGATETTAKCTNIPKSITSGELGTFDRCTASFGDVDLPDDNYSYADFEAIILGVGGTIEENPGNPDQYKICVPEGFRTCYSRACFRGNVGQLTRLCFVSLPNTTEPECKDFQRTWGKYEEPIGNTLATSLAVQEEMLEKLCAQSEDQELSSAKLCLIEEHLNPAGPCPKEVIELDKEAQTLTLAGDVTANYSAGQSINLQNANGEACGDATVAEGEGNVVYNAETGQTVIKIVECELEEGKTPAEIVKATPISKPVKAAIKTIKAIAIKKATVITPGKITTRG